MLPLVSHLFAVLAIASAKRPARFHQPNSGSAPSISTSGWADRHRQRQALRAPAEDKHLLDDLGLTREQALDEAEKPFWQSHKSKNWWSGWKCPTHPF
jgi:uncharacterized protein YjiS (DUF1127 family)